MTCEWYPVTNSANYYIYDPLWLNSFWILVLLRQPSVVNISKLLKGSYLVFGALVLQSAEWPQLHTTGYTAYPRILHSLCCCHCVLWLLALSDKQTGSNLPWDVISVIMDSVQKSVWEARAGYPTLTLAPEVNYQRKGYLSLGSD